MFWEQAFYQEVQANVKNLYVQKPTDRNSFMMNESIHATAYDIRISQELSALEIAAKQMMDWPTFGSEKQNDLINSEGESLLSFSKFFLFSKIFKGFLKKFQKKSFSKILKLLKKSEILKLF